MKKTNALIFSLTCLLVLPFVVHAAGIPSLDNSFANIWGSIDNFTKGIVKSLITLFATAAMAAFFFGIVQYIWGFRDGKPEQLQKGKTFMIWSIVALFVMFSIWGIIYFMQNTLGIGGNTNITIPQIQVGGSTGGTQSPLGGNQSFCTSITDQQTCLSMGCSWSTNSTCR